MASSGGGTGFGLASPGYVRIEDGTTNALATVFTALSDTVPNSQGWVAATSPVLEYDDSGTTWARVRTIQNTPQTAIAQAAYTTTQTSAILTVGGHRGVIVQLEIQGPAPNTAETLTLGFWNWLPSPAAQSSRLTQFVSPTGSAMQAASVYVQVLYVGSEMPNAVGAVAGVLGYSNNIHAQQAILATRMQIDVEPSGVSAWNYKVSYILTGVHK